ncbi:hypothetical protein KIM372_04960 [Bombiscardovia nodaiensis]|uniref:Right handed beta helix domain-containing protein n=1 Tax=Bombiscardovia nodaiensis TaxID=2932181 RepID=A0ABM8B6X5_9BIFI|nr:hypothetical protein KIM372_04960 [Bombiscardovia nodaiensis]
MRNTAAINAAIRAMAQEGGGTVVIPKGRFEVYTVVLCSQVNIFLENGAILAAARTDVRHGICDVQGELFTQTGQGGNYLEPEVNRYVGIQDHAHSYLRNSLIWGDHIQDVMIYGSGCIDGSYLDTDGYRRDALCYSDPQEPEFRNMPGHDGEWFGNKGIAFSQSSRLAVCGIAIRCGGHFACIATGVSDILLEGLLIDTNRDGIDLDCVQDATVRHCAVNSPHDDGIVVKSSLGAQELKTSHNILIEDCEVSGYDLGSVYKGAPSTDRLVCHPGISPIGRVKLGTEATGGYDLVTIRNVSFRHCFGLAIEANDGADVFNVVVEHLDMNDVSCPVFIRTGDRGRYPVTAHGTDQHVRSDNEVRLDNRQWIVPNDPSYEKFPIQRYTPSYRKANYELSDGTIVQLVDQSDPIQLNSANWFDKGDGICHPYLYDLAEQKYLPNYQISLSPADRAKMGNGVGVGHIAQALNIVVKDIRATDVDPRYPMILAGTVDGRLENIRLENITVCYRGGIRMKDAVEQRQITTAWHCQETDFAPVVQPIQWLAEKHNRLNETLLPRVRWDANTQQWLDDPYNVPEGSQDYPEPVEFGILPAYGLYARHMEHFIIEGLNVSVETDDERPAVVLDDCQHGLCSVAHSMVGQRVVLVSHEFKRHTSEEFVPHEPYFATAVRDVDLPHELDCHTVTLQSPAPGTPRDEYYPYPTLADASSGYRYSDSRQVPSDLPDTVYLPYFLPVSACSVSVGDEVRCKVYARNPACQDDRGRAQVRPVDLPVGVSFDGEELRWIPEHEGIYSLAFVTVTGRKEASITIHITVRA